MNILRYEEIYELHVETSQRKPKEIAIVSTSYARILLEAGVHDIAFSRFMCYALFILKVWKINKKSIQTISFSLCW